MLTHYASQISALIASSKALTSSQHTLSFSAEYLISLICLLPSIAAAITLTLCYQTAFHYDRFPHWVSSPWISFTGVHKPEADIFAYGLTAAGAATLCVNHVFNAYLMHDARVLNAKKLNFGLSYLIDAHVPFASSLTWLVHAALDCIMRSFMIVAAVALTVQSWINVDSHMVSLFLSPAMQSMSWFPTWAATIHIVGAAVFFFGFMFAFNVAVVLRFNAAALPASWYFKIAALVVSMGGGLSLFWNVYFTSCVVDPLLQQSAFRGGVNAIGFWQYVVTVADCLFIASFAWDYRAIAGQSAAGKPNKPKVC